MRPGTCFISARISISYGGKKRGSGAQLIESARHVARYLLYSDIVAHVHASAIGIESLRMAVLSPLALSRALCPPRHGGPCVLHAVEGTEHLTEQGPSSIYSTFVGTVDMELHACWGHLQSDLALALRPRRSQRKYRYF